MFNENEFALLCETFKKSRIRVAEASLDANVMELIDDAIRPFFEKTANKAITVTDALGVMRPNVLYRFRDVFRLSYAAFLLPSELTETVVVIGPYLDEELSHSRRLEISEQNGFSAEGQRTVEDYLSLVPYVPENSGLFMLLDSFCERMWNRSYEVEDIYKEMTLPDGVALLPSQGKDLDDTFLDMKTMEQRYALENEFMDAVALGSELRINRFFQSFSEHFFEKRTADPLRNSKNYCIIMNTLFRKAAEQGGVHPMYLDRISSQFALKIEQLPSIENLKELMVDMSTSYCRLVAKHSSKNYSPLVQKAVISIESDPSVELNLRYLAEKLNVSNAYLSTVFKKETGKTITEYIRDKRLSYAKRLLLSTNLQVQTVAQHCGMMDVQYFSKLFKKHTGRTPTEFRAENTAGARIG